MNRQRPYSIQKYFIALTILTGWLLSACTSNFDEINTDPNRIEKISPGTLLNPIIYELASFNTLRSDEFTFDLLQVSLPFPSVSGGVHRYDISENAGGSTWNTYYRWITNIREMQTAAVTAEDPNYQAIALTLNAWVYSLLTDGFGDVPMTEAGKGEEKIFQPAFDTQEYIYTTILKDLETANDLFDPSRSMIYGTDILYANNVSNWQRFCNSLRLRLLLRVMKRNPETVQTALVTMLSNPDTYPVFTKNTEAAVLKITGVTPNVSPWGRAVDFTNARAAAEFFVDNLNQFNDPRRPIFLTQARSSDGKTTIGYKGIPSGYAGGESQFDFLPSNLNVNLVKTDAGPMQSVMMTYAEVEFIKAELAQKEIFGEDAQVHYENGVKAAIEQWGAVLPADYFANEYTQYDGTLDRIMLQKYYALFFNDYQQWFEYRRTGLPKLPKGEDMRNNGIMPVRFRYPTTVQTNNAANYKIAVEKMGGDNINTKVWWEK
ncbi:SusD/RagB family nutrient-binding outer membrane lipoprotein [Cytophagaceae bacterium DM2B3-1]|uniref:SusD/RagB family nutrient-binding outer membrane lipoprotein n=1 Tax=Xanthocytophaga flava TaxID=3048013 RepID=A0ABT7CXN7_9BACT|nr:SusD/RagB family nutrient-binding outer membrane lipoprotein [Xanthocytophaga flavus]MDJ1498488.1 SusD/RagB family nutrient-binding outer membrane lipoprotein [Xanthocytophaga flavus]